MFPQSRPYPLALISCLPRAKKRWPSQGKRFSVRMFVFWEGCLCSCLVWIKKVEAAKWEAQRPGEKSELKHIEQISEVEKERFALVKQIDELELATQQYTALIEQAHDQLAKLRVANQKAKQITINPIEYSSRCPSLSCLIFCLAFNWKSTAHWGSSGSPLDQKTSRSVVFDLPATMMFTLWKSQQIFLHSRSLTAFGICAASSTPYVVPTRRLELNKATLLRLNLFGSLHVRAVALRLQLLHGQHRSEGRAFSRHRTGSI
jgi:hypothetical protein